MEKYIYSPNCLWGRGKGGLPMEVHVASHIEVEPAGIPDSAVVVDTDGGRLGEEGWYSD